MPAPSEKAIESLRRLYTLPPESHQPYWEVAKKDGMRVADIPLSERGAPDYPQSATQLAFEQLKSEYPQETARASVQPMRWFDKLGVGDAIMATYPLFNRVVYNPAIVRNMPQQEIADTLAHELTHVKQFQRQALIPRLMNNARQFQMPYMQRPWEQEAFAASAKRRKARVDRPLPTP